MSKCPCGTNVEFSVCCEPFLQGKAKPPTAEKLMRARYCAFTLADIDFIEKSTDPSSIETFDRDGTLEWAKNSTWLGLEIVSTKDGGEKDSTGMVEFIAKFKYEDIDRVHHERSDFKKRDGQWFFLDGKLVQEPVRNEPKIGRNDPCPCGSGKKYKKCCGANVA
jgi:SEC-C motif-containing protein